MQTTRPRDAGKSALVATDVQVLDSETSTDMHFAAQLNDPEPAANVAYAVETNSLKQIKDILIHIQLLLKQICDTSSQTQQRHQSQANDEECRNSWMMVAMVIDRLLLILFTLLTIIVSIVLLLNHPTYAYKHVSQPLD